MHGIFYLSIEENGFIHSYVKCRLMRMILSMAYINSCLRRMVSYMYTLTAD